MEETIANLHESDTMWLEGEYPKEMGIDPNPKISTTFNSEEYSDEG